MTPTPGRLRRGIVIGALAVSLAGAGGAAVWASTTSTPTPSPSASASAPAKGGGQAFGHAFGHGLIRGGLHGEVTVKKSDGTYATIVSQRGTVTEVTDTKLTVKSEDGYEHSYTLNADTKIRAAADRDTAVAASDLKAGDEVAVQALRSGSEDTAERVVKGPFPAPAPGHGQGRGKHRGGDGGQTQTPSPSATGSSSQS